MGKLPISVVILTRNEELNIENCLKSVTDWCSGIFIVDSYSTDGTAQIAKRYGAKIVQHPFENQAQQFNWALDNLEIKNDWILRLDADEYLTEELKNEIENLLRDSASSLRKSAAFDGYYIKRRVYFMDRWIKHGGYYPTWLLRLFRKGKARSEQRAMDEHLVLLEGKAGKLKNDFIDDNRKDLTWWIEKHNNYSSREAMEALSENYGRGKKKIYYRLPLFCRSFLYFIYRYFFRMGFLDGKEGLIFHFLQGFWYRFLVDSKLYEYKKSTKNNF